MIISIADLIKEVFFFIDFLVLLSLDCNAYSTATTKFAGRLNNEESRLLRGVWLIEYTENKQTVCASVQALKKKTTGVHSK